MKKRLLAALLACCMAASMAGAAFAADDPPALATGQEPAPAAVLTDPPQEAPPGEAETQPVPETEPIAPPEVMPAAAPDNPAPTEPPAEPDPTPEPEQTPEATPEPTAAPPESTATPVPIEATNPAPTEAPTATPAPTAEPTATPVPTPAATVQPASVQTAAPEQAAALVMDALLDDPEPTAPPAVVTSLVLIDSIQTDGCFTAVVNGGADKIEGLTYVWYRSKNGENWEQVEPQRCSGSAWNIAPGSEQKLNAALDSCAVTLGDSDRLYYKVEVTGTDGKMYDAQKQVPYYRQLQNGSFETPRVPDSSPFSYTEGGGTSHFIQPEDAATNPKIVWYTTANAKHWMGTEKGNYMEIADGTNRYYDDTRNDPAACYRISGAYDGEQFAELNCEAYGALYQDVLTVPGTTLHWSLAHSGRQGQDTMALIIAPVDVAEEITKALSKDGVCDSPAAIQAVLNGTVTVNGETKNVRDYVVRTITDGNKKWGVYNGDYAVRAGQYVSRFFFVAVSCASGDNTVGNLLDKVWFSTEAAPPVEGHANLTVTKTIAGTLTDEQRTALLAGVGFTVTRSDGTEVRTITGAEMTADTTDPTKFSYTLQDLPVTSADGRVTYRYTVAETKHEAPAGLLYLSTHAAVNGDTMQNVTADPRLTDIDVPENSTTYADFENAYALETGSLRIEKALPKNADAALRAEADAVTNTFAVESLPVGSYTLTYDDDRTVTRTLDAPGALTLTLQGVGGVAIAGVPVGSYTVTETEHPDLANYYCTTPAVQATATVQVPSGGVGTATITNDYEAYRSVTLTKRVTGGMGDTRRAFTFTAAVDGAPLTQDSGCTVAFAGGGAWAQDGFTLPHKGSVTIGRLRAGQSVTFTEETLADYATSFTDGTTVTDGHTAAAAAGAALTCVNHKDGVIPTGLRTDVAPAVLTLLAALGCGLLLRRRREG